MLIVSTQPWVLAALPVGPGGSASEVPVSGREAVAAVPALGVVAVAGALALSVLRAVGRVAAAVLLVVAGAAAVAAVVALLLDPVPAAQAAARAATGVGDVEGARTTAWPLVALVPVLGVLATGAIALVAGRSWGTSERFEAPGAAAGARGSSARRVAAAPPSPPTSAGLWDGLSRGEDPTAAIEDRPADGSSAASPRERAE
ncbi:Tryptophan-associated transmembrane protein (Trp_oprn_chp) [Quadrisphaera granulorum]|uniref:Tryptophan-associated transmembrane protein n=1 Tax=Quadrisphaera granulorum TaxID=317664 RepID=A0A316A0Z9_9ACTN|nr:tryptophan-associated transmembrane protein [Quadrisphaera granulorum]SZE97859.1 Tryptophan-associated transmembrane protein (Trp_oprn_chp) [Quadrisphaera granulorum]